MSAKVWVCLSLALVATMGVWLVYWFTSPALQGQKTICIGIGISAGAPSDEPQCVTKP